MVDVNLKVPAFEKLVDYAASGIGAVAGPMLATWRARQDAKAKLIDAQADADSLRLIAGAQADARRSLVLSGEAGHGVLEIGSKGIEQRIEFQEKKRQANIASVVREAATGLGDKEVPDREPDPDWTARFFARVQDVSSENLQRMWARILAGEVETPGRTSLYTLSTLGNMSQRDAVDFSKEMEYRISNFVIQQYRDNVRLDGSGFIFLHFQEIGLINPAFSAQKVIRLGDRGKLWLEHNGLTLLVSGAANTDLSDDLFGIGTFVLTKSGNEIADFCDSTPNFGYLSYFSKFLKERNCTLHCAPIIGRSPDGAAIYKANTLRVIDPTP